MNSTEPQTSESAGTNSKGQTAERRRAPREVVAVQAWVSAEAGTRGANNQVLVSDLSLHGVGFQSEMSFEEGSVHWIVLGGSGLRASSRLKVVSCREKPEGGYDCGAAFF